MIVNDRDVLDAAIGPAQTYPPLVVDANAELSGVRPLRVSSWLPGGTPRSSRDGLANVAGFVNGVDPPLGVQHERCIAGEWTRI